MKEFLGRILLHPLTRGMDVDDPNTTVLRRNIIQNKSFLKKIYQEWYLIMLEHIPDGEGGIMEFGSGASFIKEIIADTITADVLDIEGIDLLLPVNGPIPLPDESIRALVMTDVLHHINDPRRFFFEAGRVIRPGGVIIMIEPWVSAWSKLIYKKLHHEPFNTEVEDWEFPRQGPLSGANGALPWIIFKRDRKKFESEFPQFSIDTIDPIMPFVYLMSGGVSMRSFAPGWIYTGFRTIERMLKRININPAMFALYKLSRK